MKSRQDHIDFDRNYCAHYKPVHGNVFADYCSLGCGASAAMDRGREAGDPNMTPCIGGHKAKDALALCPKWERRSIEHAEARAKAIEDMMERMAIVGPVVAQWRIQPKPEHDRREIIECPKCKGRLHLSQASCNGHVHGHCQTEGCVSWME